MRAHTQAEYHPIKTVVMKRPSIEATIGALAPTAALFQGPFDTTRAKEEFDQLKLKLSVYAENIYEVDEVLMQSRVALEELAKNSLSNNYKELNLKDKEQLKKMNKYIIQTLDKKDLLKTVMMQPSIAHQYDNKNTMFRADVNINPVYNMMFQRDQQITTDKGIIIGNMNSYQRGSETEIMQTVFNNLGVENVYELENGGKLEGGDFLPAGKRAFIGTGLRTEKKAIKELIKRGLVGYDEIVVVEDQKKSQDEMHLDTYFNIIAEDKVALLETRIGSLDPTQQLTAHIYKKNSDDAYEKQQEMAFDKFLLTEGYKVIPITEKEQRAYGMNFLTLESNKVLGVDIIAKDKLAKEVMRASEQYGFEIDNNVWNNDFKKMGGNFLEKMIKNDVHYMTSPFNMLNMMYGSVHCMTQVIQRENSSTEQGKAYLNKKEISPN